jgi:hypothetical protein
VVTLTQRSTLSASSCTIHFIVALLITSLILAVSIFNQRVALSDAWKTPFAGDLNDGSASREGLFSVNSGRLMMQNG